MKVTTVFYRVKVDMPDQRPRYDTEVLVYKDNAKACEEAAKLAKKERVSEVTVCQQLVR